MRLCWKCFNTAGDEKPSGTRTQLHSSLSISHTSHKVTARIWAGFSNPRWLQSWWLKTKQTPQHLDLHMKLIFACKLLGKQSRDLLTSALQTTAWLQTSLVSACNIPSAQTMLLQSSYSQRRLTDLAARFLWTLIRNSLSPDHLDGFWSTHP